MLRNKYKIILFILSSIGFIAFLFASIQSQPVDTRPIVRKFPSQEVMTLVEQNHIYPSILLNKEYQLVNVWASWCSICQSEHSFLNHIAAQGVPVVGLNYRDKYNAALNYLNELGNPYQSVIYDPLGKFSIDLGVIGTPETYLVDQKGQIIFKYSGLLDQKVWNKFFSHYFKKRTS